MNYHISKSGSDTFPGTLEQPFLTIQKAADLALPGDTITVHEGVYREWVNPKNGGTEHARITYVAAPGEKVAISGAEVVTDWELVAGTTWKTTVPNRIFNGHNPYQEVIAGDWFFKNEDTFHTGEVYLDGKSMYEAQSMEGVTNPQVTENSCDQEGSLYTWFSEVGEETTTIWANFHAADPRIGNVEINVRQFVFWPELTGRGYITVRGFHLKQAATQWAPPTAFQGGLIGPHWSKGWIIEDNIISDSKNTAISLGKEISTGHNEWTRTGVKGGTQREREVIFRSLHHAGWSKDKVGGHIVRNNVIRDCEQAGIVGHLGSAFCTIENNHIYRMHYKRQWHGAEVGGIKFHAAIDTLIKGNTIHDAYRGLWLDWQAQGTHISSNVFYDNTAEDFMAEVCHGPYLLEHNLFLSKWNIKDMSTGGAFVHNLFLGKIAACVEPERYTPYHFPHETAVYGVANILGGDNRYYNNIFLRNPEDGDETGLASFWSGAVLMDGVPGNATFMKTPAGLSQYDSYPAPGDSKDESVPVFTQKLPVYIANNLYLNGASPYIKEEGAVVFEDSTMDVKIQDGKVQIQIKDANLLNGVYCKPITSDALNVSYQAEMRYEGPDGSDLALDEDFFGNRRANYTAGPFELQEGSHEITIG
ncbi:MAG: right-handed parallel beta-helix repeat-containing protein [Turicibacter sp.]|nr:right-handed parallel beta-helix repeat-containing protein [Turicibacter sp.]